MKQRLHNMYVPPKHRYSTNFMQLQMQYNNNNKVGLKMQCLTEVEQQHSNFLTLLNSSPVPMRGNKLFVLHD